MFAIRVSDLPSSIDNTDLLSVIPVTATEEESSETLTSQDAVAPHEVSAVIVALPADLAKITPSSTIATFSLDDDHFRLL